MTDILNAAITLGLLAFAAWAIRRGIRRGDTTTRTYRRRGIRRLENYANGHSRKRLLDDTRNQPWKEQP